MEKQQNQPEQQPAPAKREVRSMDTQYAEDRLFDAPVSDSFYRACEADLTYGRWN